ncbi:hypothetical protein GCM10010424_24410 [Streptomyces lienomycini]
MWHADARGITYEGLWWKPPPRAGPYPPPTDRPVFCALPAARFRAPRVCAHPRYARNEEFTGAPPGVMAWRHS